MVSDNINRFEFIPPFMFPLLSTSTCVFLTYVVLSQQSQFCQTHPLPALPQQNKCTVGWPHAQYQNLCCPMPSPSSGGIASWACQPEYASFRRKHKPHRRRCWCCHRGP